MSVPWITAFGVLSVCVLLIAVLLLGTLRRISGVLEQAEARLRDAPHGPGPGGLEPGTALPAFRARRFDGGWTTDEDLRGSPALVVFASSTCPACSGLIQGLRRNGAELSIRSYVVVNSDEEVHALRLENVQNVLIQPDGELSIAFRTSTTPHAFAINRSGVIAAVSTPNNLSQLQELVPRAITRGGAASRQQQAEVVPS
ncbi:MAG: redoxin domain-containing protein [Actinobacteria bacterium]|nr:redoxin domain-containing protein [Actinomycetota bacterium]